MKLKNNLYILMIMTFLSCGENAPIQCFTPQDPRLQNRSGDIMNDLYKHALPLDKALRLNDIDDDEVTGSSHLRQISQELNASRSKLWKTRRINVCWINPSDDPVEKELREAIRQKIADTWEEALFIDDSKNIKFTDWGRCTSVNDKQIRIMIEDVRPRSKVGTDLADRSKKGLGSVLILSSKVFYMKLVL